MKRVRAFLRRRWWRLAPQSFLRYGAPSAPELGAAAEELAARALRRAGWRVRGRRVRTPHGEVDVVALRAGVLACVEVKAARVAGRRATLESPWSPAPADLRWRPARRVDRRRLARQRRACRWLAGRLGAAVARVDVIEVWVPRGLAPVVLHHPDVRRPLPHRVDREKAPGSRRGKAVEDPARADGLSP